MYETKLTFIFTFFKELKKKFFFGDNKIEKKRQNQREF